MAARCYLTKMLDWDFDRVVVAHGKVLHRDGRSFVEAVFN